MATTKWLEASFTPDTSAYADLDTVGVAIALTDDILTKQSVLTDIVIASPDTQNPGFDVFLFDTIISASSTVTDNNATSLAAADRANIVHVQHMTDSFVDNAGVTYKKSGLSVPWRAALGNKCYVVIQARGAITYAASQTLTIRFGFVEL